LVHGDIILTGSFIKTVLELDTIFNFDQWAVHQKRVYLKIIENKEVSFFSEIGWKILKQSETTAICAQTINVS
jgi:hypothetical protein